MTPDPRVLSRRAAVTWWMAAGFTSLSLLHAALDARGVIRLSQGGHALLAWLLIFAAAACIAVAVSNYRPIARLDIWRGVVAVVVFMCAVPALLVLVMNTWLFLGGRY